LISRFEAKPWVSLNGYGPDDIAQGTATGPVISSPCDSEMNIADLRPTYLLKARMHDAHVASYYDPFFSRN
jgi:hypothetical protein